MSKNSNKNQSGELQSPRPPLRNWYANRLNDKERNEVITFVETTERFKSYNVKSSKGWNMVVKETLDYLAFSDDNYKYLLEPAGNYKEVRL